MTGLEIGLSVMVVFAFVMLVVAHCKEVDLKEKISDKQRHNNELSNNNIRFQDSLVVRGEQVEKLEDQVNELKDKLKAIEDLKKAGKEWWITLVLKTLEGKEEEGYFKADRVEFIAGYGDCDKGIVSFYSGEDDHPVLCIERENYILHKKELVDIEKPEKEG